MRRRILTFMLIPALGGFLATILSLVQGGTADGPLILVIVFLELPSILLMLPALDVLPWTNYLRDYPFLIVIVIPTLMNLGLFAFAGLVSWMWFPSPRTGSTAEGLSNRLNQAGWSIQDANSSAVWVVTGEKGGHIIRAEGGSRAEALRRVYDQAAAVDVRVQSWQPSSTNFLFAILCIGLGHLFAAFFGWFLIVLYGFASMNGPGVQGIARLSLTLKKMLDPRDGLWGTVPFLAGIIGGLLLTFTGCYRLSQITDSGVSTNSPASSSSHSSTIPSA
jgi:hypothetical protein